MLMRGNGTRFVQVLSPDQSAIQTLTAQSKCLTTNQSGCFVGRVLPRTAVGSIITHHIRASPGLCRRRSSAVCRCLRQTPRFFCSASVLCCFTSCLYTVTL
uniref:Uncharacterized protein n=1 Tax=Sander lucioperca TaxID=283035 RepID=A0A8C9ZK05_SANLU